MTLAVERPPTVLRGQRRSSLSIVLAVGPASERDLETVNKLATTAARLDDADLVVVDDLVDPPIRAVLARLAGRARVLHLFPRLGNEDAAIAGATVGDGDVVVFVAPGREIDGVTFEAIRVGFDADPGVGLVEAPGAVALRRLAIETIGGFAELRRRPGEPRAVAETALVALRRAGWRKLTLPGSCCDAGAGQSWPGDKIERFTPNERLVWRPPPIAASPRPGLNVIGLLDAACGIGDAARRYVDAVEVAEIPVATFSFGLHDSPERPFRHRGPGSLAYDTTLLALNPDRLPPFSLAAGAEVWAGRYTIGLWFWEVEELNPTIEAGFSFVNEVWASTPFLHDAFGRATDRPVTTIPLPVPRREGRPTRTRAQLGLPEDFLFATIFDFGSLAERKNALGVVRAFSDAFAPGSGAVLVLKTLNAALDRTAVRGLEAAIAGRRDIIVVDGYLDDDAISDLIGHADCYVSLHRAEGFGLTPAEAMAWGRPVIATGYSGNLAYMTPENSYLVGYDLVSVPERFHHIYRQGSHWAEPHHHEAVDAMRTVVARPVEAEARGKKGQVDIRRTNSTEAAASAISRRLRESAAYGPASSGHPDGRGDDPGRMSRRVETPDHPRAGRPSAQSIARQLAGDGVAVHLITRAHDARSLRSVEQGVTVHRIASAHLDVPGGGAGPEQWATAAAAYYRILDELVDFDVVISYDASVADGDLDLSLHTAFVPPPAGTDPEQLSLALDGAPRTARLLDTIVAPKAVGPRLGVVCLAHNALSATKRMIRSVLHHTSVPFRIIVVDNGSRDDSRAWLRSLDDPRVALVELEENLGVPAGRNAGIAALDGDEEFVVFLDNDVEVLAHWWQPFVSALGANPLYGIAGESGRNITWGPSGPVSSAPADPGISRCDVAAGFCMVARRQVIGAIGRFDDQLGLFWHDDDDYALRARHLGIEIVRVASGLVLHGNHPSADTVAGVRGPDGAPSLLAAQNQRLLQARHDRQRLTPTSPFLVLGDASAIVADPDALSTYGAAFTGADAVAFVIVGIDADPAEIGPALEAAAERVGFDLADGPRVIVMTPPSADIAGLGRLAEEVHLCLGPAPAAAPFSHLGRVATGDPDELRRRAAGVWRARPVAAQPA